MSSIIPGNQKHLTLTDRQYIEDSLEQGCSFKDIARFLCKDPTTISKEIRLHRWMMCTPNGSSTTLIISVPDAFAVVRPMSAVRSSSATRNALPASNAIRCVILSSKSSAAVSTGLPTSATAVRNPAAAVPFPINIFTMPTLRTVSMKSFALLPGRESISPAMRLCR